MSVSSGEFATRLYETYGKDLADLQPLERLRPSIGKSYAGEEGRLLYLMTRFVRPELIFEFSPKRGWSTAHMASALERNAKGRIISFELDPNYVWAARRTLRRLGLEHRARFVVGDVREELPRVYETLRSSHGVTGIDFLFIDSDHGEPFARWYIDNLFPLVKQSGVIHVHDIQAAPERVVRGERIFPEPSGEERLLAHRLTERPHEYRWFSVSELVRDERYLADVRRLGGGRLEFPPNRGWPLHPVEKAIGFERSPSLWITKVGEQETATYPGRPFDPLMPRLSQRVGYTLRKRVAFAYAPFREMRIAARRRAKSNVRD
jgi:predicted O-methyltransferase YrrM